VLEEYDALRRTVYAAGYLSDPAGVKIQCVTRWRTGRHSSRPGPTGPATRPTRSGAPASGAAFLRQPTNHRDQAGVPPRGSLSGGADDEGAAGGFDDVGGDGVEVVDLQDAVARSVLRTSDRLTLPRTRQPLQIWPAETGCGRECLANVRYRSAAAPYLRGIAARSVQLKSVYFSVGGLRVAARTRGCWAALGGVGVVSAQVRSWAGAFRVLRIAWRIGDGIGRVLKASPFSPPPPLSWT
jgi:hypothetical protein